MQKLLAILMLLFFTACQSPHVYRSDYQDPALFDLAVYALSLEGTPYKYGGTSPETGFDCSGFVGYVFKHSLGKTLPRTSDEISQVGDELNRDELKPGDLVFYNTQDQSNSHVGIYLGEGEFIHSPGSGKSVSVVQMNGSYWRKRYNGARRISP